MPRFLIYVFPAVADVILAATMFVCSNRLADAGQSRTEVAMVFAAWAAVYIASNQALARLVTSRNAAVMMTVANVLFVAFAGIFVCIENVWAIYAAMGGIAVATALFFLPFQVFMKAVEPDPYQGVARSVAIYTFSWSLGFAIGPFITGFIYQGLGWRWCFVFTGLLGFFTTIGIQLLKHHAKYHHSEASAENHLEAPPGRDKEAVNYHAMPDLAWLGWLAGGVGCLGIYSLISLLPSAGVAFAMAKSQVGSIIALLYVVQALVGLSFLRSRNWMFRPGPVVGLTAFGVVGLAGFALLLLPFCRGVQALSVCLRTLGLYASAACYGVFSGSFFFGLVFYSLVHPHQSARYVAVNEMIVGICGVAGPIIAGLLADQYGFAVPPTVLMAMTAGIALLQFTVLRQLTVKNQA